MTRLECGPLHDSCNSSHQEDADLDGSLEVEEDEEAREERLIEERRRRLAEIKARHQHQQQLAHMWCREAAGAHVV